MSLILGHPPPTSPTTTTTTPPPPPTFTITPNTPPSPSAPASPRFDYLRGRLVRFTSSSSVDRVNDLRNEYVPAVPNLELHSAAAEGNVGLVHYALTHGQPINSVLHGVQAIHAAAAGGSTSAMRMLIERGADVNAPRLPRRYSNEKKRNVPALGAAGATPLHFAAANGHAEIVQMLLASGAVPDKADKLGQTPESLAEHNGHDDVLRALQVYENIKAEDGASIHGGASSDTAGPSSDRGGSPLPADVADDAASFASSSKKGKERAFSFASSKSDHQQQQQHHRGGVLRMKKSFEGFLGRKTHRSGSMASRMTDTSSIPEEETPDVPDIPPSLRISTIDGGSSAEPTPDPFGRMHTPEQRASPGLQPVSPADGNAISLHSPTEAFSPLSLSPQPSNLPATGPSPGESPMSPSSPVSQDMNRALSTTSGTSEGHTAAAAVAAAAPLPPPPRRELRVSGSSRRPSLPSIFEKAAHPGQAFRAALRRDHHHNHHHHQTGSASSPQSPVEPLSSGTMSTEDGSAGSMFRGRLRSNESALSTGSSNGSGMQSAQSAARRYITKHNIANLFRRSHSPPSRSPSPPRRGEVKPVELDRMDENVERMRRVSLEMDRRERRSRSGSFASEGDAEELLNRDSEDSQRPTLPEQPKSAPASKTRFFEDVETPPVTAPPTTGSPAAAITATSPPQRTLDGRTTPIPVRSPNRPRKGSEVIVPSPLANEYARGSDSDSGLPNVGVRRSKTESRASPTPSRFTSGSGDDPQVIVTKPRSSTLPSSAHPPVIIAPPPPMPGDTADPDWEDRADLRKVAAARAASGILLAGSEGDDQLGADTSEDDEVFHDAEADVVVAQPVSITDACADAATLNDGHSRIDSMVTAHDSVISAESHQVTSEDVDSADETGGEDQTTPTAEDIPEPRYDVFEHSRPTQGRYRGESIGSMTTESSRILTPLGSSVRVASIVSEDGSSDRHHIQLAAIPSGNNNSSSRHAGPYGHSHTKPENGRARGISVSSASTSASSRTQSHGQSSSSIGTSLSPPSVLSITLGGNFPPVPEHDVPGLPRRTGEYAPPRRTVSTRAEAADLVKRSEQDILHLATLPPSLDSSRSLAAQLAAYGESHAIEQELAERERRQRRTNRRIASGASSSSGPRTMGDSSDDSSFVSARTTPSAVSTDVSSNARRLPQPPNPADLLVDVEAPRTSVPSINHIYDRRAAAYRDRMSALTKPVIVPPAGHRARSTRSRLTTEYGSAPSWLTEHQHHHQLDRDGAQSSRLDGATSRKRPPHRTKSAAAAADGSDRLDGTMTAPSSFVHSSFPQRANSTPSSHTASMLARQNEATKRATGIIPNRYGLPPPVHPSRLAPSEPALGSGPYHPNTPSASRAPSYIGPARSMPQPVRPLTLAQVHAGPSGGSPYISVFSNRYAGPHDGGDSDDEEGNRAGFTMIENDWRGARVVDPASGPATGTAEHKKKKWLRSAIPSLGRK